VADGTLRYILPTYIFAHAGCHLLHEVAANIASLRLMPEELHRTFHKGCGQRSYTGCKHVGGLTAIIAAATAAAGAVGWAHCLQGEAFAPTERRVMYAANQHRTQCRRHKTYAHIIKHMRQDKEGKSAQLAAAVCTHCQFAHWAHMQPTRPQSWLATVPAHATAGL
jgi:hypothetical protein